MGRWSKKAKLCKRSLWTSPNLAYPALLLYPTYYSKCPMVHRFTPSKVLLKQCGWMPVKHLMAYHSLVLVHKTIQHQTPEYLYKKITSGSEQPNTRQAAEAAAAMTIAGMPKQPTLEECDLSLKKKSLVLVNSSVVQTASNGSQIREENRHFQEKTQRMGDQ